MNFQYENQYNYIKWSTSGSSSGVSSVFLSLVSVLFSSFLPKNKDCEVEDKDTTKFLFYLSHKEFKKMKKKMVLKQNLKVLFYLFELTLSLVEFSAEQRSSSCYIKSEYNFSHHSDRIFLYYFSRTMCIFG